jgi:transposase
MHPKSQRRVHSAEFKAQVLAECQEPGASVAAIALTHGLNVNLVRKWLVGRGIKRTGLPAQITVASLPAAVTPPAAAALQFIPVGLATEAPSTDRSMAATASDIHVELNRGGTQLCVRWPSTQSDSCAAWLRDLAAAAFQE